jgi:hypothetical protein
MTDSDVASAQADVTINADPATVYRLLTDLSTLAALAAETYAMKWRKGGAAVPGAVFKGHNRNGSRKWTTMCTVTDADAGRTFAFDVRTAGIVPVARWRYDIEPVDGGCKVTERTWDRRPRWIRKPAELTTGVRDRAAANTQHIKATLQWLKAEAEAHR